MRNIEKIEQNTFGHFKYLPTILGFSVKSCYGSTLINCGFGSSMFNIVCDTSLIVVDLDTTIKKIIQEFNGQPFAWWIGPSSSSKALSQKLLDYGFIIETTEHAMMCDLKEFESANSNYFEIHQVSTKKELEDYIQVLEPYDPSARLFYEKLTNPLLSIQEELFVGYEANRPVTIGTLYLKDDTGGIFSLITQENKRGLGYGTQMMSYLLKRAKKNGVRYATLSASSDSGYRIYKRLGFESLGQFECFEWKGTKKPVL